MDGQSSIAISILLKFFICENKNLNPHYPGLITGAAPEAVSTSGIEAGQIPK